MNDTTTNPSQEPAGCTGEARVGEFASSADLWVAGVRYPSGAEIWCAHRGGAAAWTPDRKLAAKYPSESIAAMAARHLTEGEAVPFWTADEP